jgi:Saxitoxin biosynthesis operon protein SxtJ
MSVNEPIVSHRKAKSGSDRVFGLTFACVLAIIALWPLWSGGTIRWWAAICAAAFAMAAFAAPSLLAPLNRGWLWLGDKLHRIVNPVIMGLIYFGSVVPTGLILRWQGKDPLRLRRDPDAATYWVPRQPPGPAPGSMPKQF